MSLLNLDDDCLFVILTHCNDWAINFQKTCKRVRYIFLKRWAKIVNQKIEVCQHCMNVNWPNTTEKLFIIGNNLKPNIKLIIWPVSYELPKEFQYNNPTCTCDIKLETNDKNITIGVCIKENGKINLPKYHICWNITGYIEGMWDIPCYRPVVFKYTGQNKWEYILTCDGNVRHRQEKINELKLIKLAINLMAMNFIDKKILVLIDEIISNMPV